MKKVRKQHDPTGESGDSTQKVEGKEARKSSALKSVGCASGRHGHPQLLGGDLAILTFAGKGATAEFDVHHSGVVATYAPDAIKSVVFSGKRSCYEHACNFQILSVIFLIRATRNLKISSHRAVLSRGAAFLIFFIVVHAVENLYESKGPDEFDAVDKHGRGLCVPVSALLHVLRWY